MLKTQKTFSPLECGLCKNYACRYRGEYIQLYNIGFKVPIKDCERLNKQRSIRK